MREQQSSYKSFKTILMFFGFDGEDYWHIDYPLHQKTYNGKRYFFDISKKANYTDKFDEKGIQMYKGQDGNYYYGVIPMGHYALGLYECYLKDNNPLNFQKFLLHCDWLVDNLENHINCNGVWINRYSMSVFGLKGQWSSALSQAMGISCLTRAFIETNDDKYLKAAKLATTPYFMKIEDGGVLTKDDDFVCLQEYTTQTPSYVLNGFIFGIWSLYDLINLCDDKEINELYEQCVKSLRINIHKYDTKFWSRYDLWSDHYNPASYFYMKLHIKQLNILYSITNIEEFKFYSDKWNKKMNNRFFSFITLLQKVRFRVFKK